MYLLKPPRWEFPQSLSQDGCFLLAFGPICPSTGESSHSPSTCLQKQTSLLLAPFKLGLASWKEKNKRGSPMMLPCCPYATIKGKEKPTKQNPTCGVRYETTSIYNCTTWFCAPQGWLGDRGARQALARLPGKFTTVCLWKTWPAREAVVNKRQIFRSLQEKCITTAPTPAHSQILTTVKLKQVQLPFRNTLMLKRLCLHLPYTGLQKSDYISSPRLMEKVASDKREWVCYTWKWSAAIQSKVIYHSVSLYWPVSFSIYKNSSGLILFLYRRNPLDPFSWTTSFVFSWTRVLTYKT